MESARPEVDLQNAFPLHWPVWHNDHEALSTVLHHPHNLEMLDPRGRTPLMLAVTLGHIGSARVLLLHGADANCENADGWSVAQEAVARGDPELVRLIVRHRELQRQRTRAQGIPRLLQRLRDAPDFYVEMRWEFASWVPLVSRLCPSDTYRVYKRGANVRVDTTLLGFEQSAGNWQRGSRSYVFRGEGEGCTLLEVDHDARQVIVDEMVEQPIADAEDMSSDLGDYMIDNETIERRLSAPIVATYIDTDKIAFERNKSSGLGTLMGALWRSNGQTEGRTENVAGHECRVFAATNVQLVTKTRTEHLKEAGGSGATFAAANSAATPLQSLLSSGAVTTHEQTRSDEPSGAADLTAVEYFAELGGDIGLRQRRVETRVQRFKATLWLAAQYPLSLPEQVLPVVDLMATSSPHFAKLRDFIRLQLPAGFPVKIEIPLFHVLNARITFTNIFAKDSPVECVSSAAEEDGGAAGTQVRLTCVVDDAAFEPPAAYTVIGGAGGGSDRAGHPLMLQLDEQDELLQFAIQQSLLDAPRQRGAADASAEEVDIWEALRYDNSDAPALTSRQRQQQQQQQQQHLISEEERQLQRAIQASLSVDAPPTSNAVAVTSNLDAEEILTEQQQQDKRAEAVEDDLLKAIRLSEEERLQEERRQQQEQRELEAILRLSLSEM